MLTKRSENKINFDDIKNKGTKEINSKVLEYFNVTEKDMWRLDIPQLRIIEDILLSTLRAKDRKFGGNNRNRVKTEPLEEELGVLVYDYLSLFFFII